MDASGDWPTIPLPLLEKLQDLFPAECIQPNEDPCEAHRRAGRNEVVNLLTVKYIQQSNAKADVPS